MLPVMLAFCILFRNMWAYLQGLIHRTTPPAFSRNTCEMHLHLYRKQNVRLHPNDSTLLPKLYFFTDEGKCFPCGQKEEIHSFFSFEPYTQTLLLLLKLISNEKHSFSFQIPEQSLTRGFCPLGKSLCKTFFAWLLQAAGMQHPQLGLISRPLAHQHNLSVEVDY